MLVYCGRAFWRGLAAVVLLYCVAVPVAAQTKLSGVIKDEKGRAGINVPVVARNEETGERFDTVSTDIGYYQFLKLPPGRYVVTVDLYPFKPLIAKVEITATMRSTRDFSLEVRAEDATEVRANLPPPPTMLAPDGSLGATFSREMLETTPLMNGRTLQSFLSLVPGIVITDSVGTLAQFTAAGQRRFSNRFTIDGISADLAVDIRGQGIGEAGSGALPAFSTLGGTQTLVPMAAIEEIDVRTTNATPEQARTPGAQTIVVTRAGSNQFKGSAFLDVRPDGLNAANWFDNGETVLGPKGLIHHNSDLNTGVSAGGPLLPRRMFFFGVWERQEIDRPLEATIEVPASSTRATAPTPLRSVLEAFPISNGQALDDSQAEFSNRFPAISKLSTLSARVDANVSTRLRGFARFNLGASDGDALSTFQTPIYLARKIEKTSTRTATVGLNSMSSAVVHELRVNLTGHRGSVTASPSEFAGAAPMPLALLIPGLPEDTWVNFRLSPGAAGPVLSGSWGTSSNAQIQIIDTWTLSKRRHEWRFGFDFRQITASSSSTPKRYTYRFASVEDFLQGQLQFLTVDYLLPARARLKTWAGFVQDTFRVSPRFSLDYGLRYFVNPAPSSLTSTHPLLFDLGQLPDLVPLRDGVGMWKTSWTNFAPRIAAAYRLTTESGQEATVRAGWSLTFDELTNPGASAFGRGYPYAVNADITPSTFPVTSAELDVPPPSFGSSNRAEAYAFQTNLRSPRTYEWQVGIDRMLGSGRRASLAYAGAAARDLVYWHAFYPLDPNHPIHAYANSASSDYHALLADYSQRLGHRVQGRVAYTWSHTIDTDSGEGPGPNPPPAILSPSTNRASADFDRRHILRVSASFTLPTAPVPKPIRAALTDWQVDIGGTVISGAPVSVLSFRRLDSGLYWLRPDTVDGASLWLDDSTSPTGQRINVSAFKEPTDREQGNLGRNTLHASMLRQVDVSLSRQLRIGRMTARVGLDAFNVLNIPNFGPPVNQFKRTEFGAPELTYAQALGTGTLDLGGLAPIQQVGGQRSLQLRMRLDW